MNKKPQNLLYIVLGLSAVLCAAICWLGPFEPYRLYIAGGAFAVSLIVLAILYGVMASRAKQARALMDNVFQENERVAGRIISEVSVPCLLCDDEGSIVWSNEIFKKMTDVKSLRLIMPSFNPAQPLAAFAFDFAGGSYQVMSKKLKRKSTDRSLTFQYWIDRTEAEHYKRLHEEQMPYVALIYVDNYEELTSDIQFHRTAVLAEVERLVSETTTALMGTYRRYENGRFLLIFEAKQLEKLEQERFPLLEAAHRIDTGTGASVSLSIAVGVADRIGQSDESARQAMELALGRGGDQAVIKAGANYRFFGGKRQLDALQSRVKARLFAKALRQLFENAGDVFIMGHKQADMDCIGAALGIATCAKQIGSRAFIVLDQNNASIDRVLEHIYSNAAYAGMVISPEQAEKMLRPTSVLVIVDTQRPQTTIAPELIPQAARIVLIDHHRRSADYIDNTTLHYLESRASSASELITEVVQYFDDTLRPPAFVCGALLAGITVDTKHFAFNVGSRTFEAAGYLRRNGADISMVKQLFQDDMQSYRDCADTVLHAEIMGAHIAVACCPEGTENAKLIAAKAADELVGIRGIEAAFVLGEENGIISVSGRSLGSVNAQLVCEKLGGGGHLTMAGAQFRDTVMAVAMEHVKASILEYVKEANLT